MKRYGQACAIARALDVVGERWSLLLVRQLTLGPRRYRDLATGLPGIPLTARRGARPAGNACAPLSAAPYTGLVTAYTTGPEAVWHTPVAAPTETARRPLEPLAATRTRPAPAI